MIQEPHNQQSSNCLHHTKSSLCRFYLRGTCRLTAEKCGYAHGIDDLNFIPYMEGQTIHWQFMGDCCAFYQKEQPVKSYHCLHQYVNKGNQCILSLQEINENRALKKKIRTQMHYQQFDRFMQLLHREYPNTLFSEETLHREFARLGFMKLMTRIKYGHLQNHILNSHQYFKLNTPIIPYRLSYRKNLYLLRASKSQINQQYLTLCLEYMQRCQKKGWKAVNEEALKLYMMKQPRNWKNVPSLNTILSERKCSLRELIMTDQDFADLKKQISEGDLPAIESEEEIIAQLLRQDLSVCFKENGYCFLNTDIYDTMTHRKFNNRNLIAKCLQNCLKQPIFQEIISIKLPILGEILATKQHLQPKPTELQSIQYSQQNDKQLEQYINALKNQSQKFKMHKQMSLQENANLRIVKNSQQNIYIYKQRLRCYVIDHVWQLVGVYQELLGSPVLAIDLEGALNNSKHGYISMISIYSPARSAVFLLDYLMMAKTASQHMEFISVVIYKCINSRSVMKIFHDCRNDLYALKHLLHPCSTVFQPQNILDTSVAHIAICQFESRPSKMSAPGLNQVLTDYATDAINTLKQKYHAIWSQGNEDPSLMRPIPTEFIEYCIMDVVGLPEVVDRMSETINQDFLKTLSCMICTRIE